MRIQREADDERVRHLHSAKAGRIADAGAAVDKDIVVFTSDLPFNRLDQFVTTALVEELAPVERVDPRAVIHSLLSRREQMQLAKSVLTSTVPIQLGDVAEYVDVLVVPGVRKRPKRFRVF